MWDHRVAAAAPPTHRHVEVMPFDMSSPDGFLHYRLLALLGMTIGEFWCLDDLAADCADDGVYEGLLTSVLVEQDRRVGLTGECARNQVTSWDPNPSSRGIQQTKGGADSKIQRQCGSRGQ